MSKTVTIRRTALAFGLAALMVTLGGCREEEQDRVLMFEKGKYLGQEDEQLPAGTVDDLRYRVRQQGPW